MQISNYSEPFPFVIIEDFLTDEQYDIVFSEIVSLISYLKYPNETGSAFDVVGNDKVYKKQNLGIYLDEVFESNRQKSAILRYYDQIYQKDIMEVICENGWFYEHYFPTTNHDSTLLQMYGDGDHYKKHKDYTNFTIIGLYHTNPKKFEGGELIFPNYDLEIELENNQLIIFPSQIPHEVLPVKSNSNEVQDNRFTVTRFISRTITLSNRK